MRDFIVHTKEQASKHRCFEGHASEPESSSISTFASNKCIMIAILKRCFVTPEKRMVQEVYISKTVAINVT